MLRAGQWRSSAYRLYLDLGEEEAAAMPRILIEASSDGRDETEGPQEEPIP